jgi:hypothetical protein
MQPALTIWLPVTGFNNVASCDREKKWQSGVRHLFYGVFNVVKDSNIILDMAGFFLIPAADPRPGWR